MKKCCLWLCLCVCILAFARALGEYGATSMIAGYIKGKTATISTTVYALWRDGLDAEAFKWVMINIAISAVVLLIVNFLEKKEKGLMSLMAEGKVDDYLQWYIQSTSPDARH